MQLRHMQAVLLAQQLTRDQRGAGVVTQLPATVEVFDHADVRLEFGWQIVLLPDAGDTFQVLPGAFSMLAA